MKKRHFYDRQQRKILFFIGLGALIIVLALIVYGIMYLFSEERQVVQVAEQFYEYEQDGDFGNSWELFHSSMKKRFNKGTYMEDRAHVFLNHFGVDSFDFSLGDPTEIKNFEIAEDPTVEYTVYRIDVTCMYDSKYGYLEIKQPVILIEEESEWKVLWDYNQ
ncbi:hypothetical protein MUN88_20575 [Gracilibacillus caseinilyticus]|uniref:DUF4878 domain-containing protein n=1 Tax=Gracilibacillus caseinilyticus TaxID=2932256 RepID=A0ABY4EVG7_9BACI|nr:hypothetical protein [Gracilibacillus caseinilyticus]UOQ48397.1 hypothetical protein MUN88_20575 [Gracilibacillus caseinilyticus]